MTSKTRILVHLLMAIGAPAFIAGSLMPAVHAAELRGNPSIDAWHSYGTAGASAALAGIMLWLAWRSRWLGPGAKRSAPLLAGLLIVAGAIAVLVRAIGYTTHVNPDFDTGLKLGRGLAVLAGGALLAAAAAWKSIPSESRWVPEHELELSHESW